MPEIRVNEAQWNALSEAERNRIVDGLRQSGALHPDDVLVGDPNTPEMTADTPLDPMWNPLKDACKALCDVTSRAALAWCMANTAGAGLAVCIAAAEAARAECRRRC